MTNTLVVESSSNLLVYSICLLHPCVAEALPYLHSRKRLQDDCYLLPQLDHVTGVHKGGVI